VRDDFVPSWALLMATPHLNPLPFEKGRGGSSPVGPKLTINEHYCRTLIPRNGNDVVALSLSGDVQRSTLNAQRPTPNQLAGHDRWARTVENSGLFVPSPENRMGKPLNPFLRDAAATDAKPGRRGDFRHPNDGLYAAKQRPGFQTSTFTTANPSCGGRDACATRSVARARPWRRGRARPWCQMGSWSGSWSGCRRRRRWLVSEGAVETLEGAPGEETAESACGDIHEVHALSHRRGIEMECYFHSTTADDVAVRRDPINREVARLDSARIHWSAHIGNKISQLRKDSAVTGRLGTVH